MAAAGSGLDMRFIVTVLPPPLTADNEPWEPTTNERTPQGTKVLAVPARRDEQIKDFWQRIEERFAQCYGYERNVYFSRLQTSEGADLMRFDSVGVLYGNLPHSEWKVIMRRCKVAVKDSLPAESWLRPEGFEVPELSQEEAERRREQRGRYGVEVDEMDVDRPVGSRELDDGETEAGAAGEGRTDQDGFKIPALPKSRSARKKDVGSDSEGEQSRKSQTPTSRKHARSPTANSSDTASAKKKRKRSKADKAGAEKAKTAAAELEERKKSRKKRKQSRSQIAGSEPPQGNERVESTGGGSGSRGVSAAPNIDITKLNNSQRKKKTQSSQGQVQITPDSGQHLSSHDPPESAQRPGQRPPLMSGALNGEEIDLISEDAGIQQDNQDDVAIDDDLLLPADDNDGANSTTELPTQANEPLPSSVPLPNAALPSETPAIRPSKEHPSSQSAFDTLVSSQTRSNKHSSGKNHPDWTPREDAILLKSIYTNLKTKQVISRYQLDRSDSALRGRKRTLLKRFPDAARIDRSSEVGDVDVAAEPGSSPVKAKWSNRDATLLRQAVVDGFEDSEIRNMHFPSRSLESVAKQIRRSEKSFWFGEKAGKDFPSDKIELHGWKERHSAFLKRAVRNGMDEDEACARWFSVWPKKMVKRKFEAFRKNLEELGGFNKGGASNRPQTAGGAEAEDLIIDSSPPWMPDTANRPAHATPAALATESTSAAQTTSRAQAAAAYVTPVAGLTAFSSPRQLPRSSPTTTRPAPPSTGQLRRPTTTSTYRSRGVLAHFSRGANNRASSSGSNRRRTAPWSQPPTTISHVDASQYHARTNSPHVLVSNSEQSSARLAVLAMPTQDSQDSQQTTLSFPRDKGKRRADGQPRPSGPGDSSRAGAAGAEADLEDEAQQQQSLEIPETVQDGESQMQPLTQQSTVQAPADGAVQAGEAVFEQPQQEAIVVDSKNEDDSFATAAETLAGAAAPASKPTSKGKQKQKQKQKQKRRQKQKQKHKELEGSSPGNAIDVSSSEEPSDAETEEEDADVAIPDATPAAAEPEVQVHDSLTSKTEHIPDSFAVPAQQTAELGEQAQSLMQILAPGKASNVLPAETAAEDHEQAAEGVTDTAEVECYQASVLEVSPAAHEAATPSSRRRTSNDVTDRFLRSSETRRATNAATRRGHGGRRHSSANAPTTARTSPRSKAQAATLPQDNAEDPIRETSTQDMAMAAVTPRRKTRTTAATPFFASASRRSTARRPAVADDAANASVGQQLTQELQASQEREAGVCRGGARVEGVREVWGGDGQVDAEPEVDAAIVGGEGMRERTLRSGRRASQTVPATDERDEQQDVILTPASPRRSQRARRSSRQDDAAVEVAVEEDNESRAFQTQSTPPQARGTARSPMVVPTERGEGSEDESQAFQTQATPPRARPTRRLSRAVPAVRQGSQAPQPQRQDLRAQQASLREAAPSVGIPESHVRITAPSRDNAPPLPAESEADEEPETEREEEEIDTDMPDQPNDDLDLEEREINDISGSEHSPESIEPMTLEEFRALGISQVREYLLRDPRIASPSPPLDVKAADPTAADIWNTSIENYREQAREAGTKEHYVNERAIMIKAWDLHLRALATGDDELRRQGREWERREVLKERARRGEGVIRYHGGAVVAAGEDADEEVLRDSDIDIGSQCGLSSVGADDRWMFKGQLDREGYREFGWRIPVYEEAEDVLAYSDEDGVEDGVDVDDEASQLGGEPRVVELESESGERTGPAEDYAATIQEEPFEPTWTSVPQPGQATEAAPALEEGSAEAFEQRCRDYLDHNESISVYDDSSMLVGSRNDPTALPPSPTINIASPSAPQMPPKFSMLSGMTPTQEVTPRSARGWVENNEGPERDPHLTDSMLPPWREEAERQEPMAAEAEEATADDQQQVEAANGLPTAFASKKRKGPSPGAAAAEREASKLKRPKTKSDKNNDNDLMPPPALPGSDCFRSEASSSNHNSGNKSRRQRRKSANLRKNSLEQQRCSSGAVGGNENAINRLRESETQGPGRSSSVIASSSPAPPPHFHSTPPVASYRAEMPAVTSQETTQTASWASDPKATSSQSLPKIAASAWTPKPKTETSAQAKPMASEQSQTQSQAQEETPLREHFDWAVRNPDPAPPTPKAPEPYQLPSFMMDDGEGSRHSSSSSSSSSSPPAESPSVGIGGGIMEVELMGKLKGAGVKMGARTEEGVGTRAEAGSGEADAGGGKDIEEDEESSVVSSDSEEEEDE